MIKEFITHKSKDTSIKVAGNEINAIRVKDIVKKGVRVYDNDKVGFAGSIGDSPDELLVEQAIDNLKVGIDYPYEMTTNNKDHRDLSDRVYSPSELKEIMDSILETLKKDYPEFMFSHMMTYSEMESSMRNTEGLDLKFKDSTMDLGLILKERSSANLFDGYIGYTGRKFDLDDFWTFYKPFLESHKTAAALPEGEKLPAVFISSSAFAGFLGRQLNGEKFATKASIYSDKMDKQLFNEKVNIFHSQDPVKMMRSFYDTEGVVLENDQVSLIKDGQLVSVVADKKTAADYDLPHTGGASGDYDSKPMLFMPNLDIAVDSTDLVNVLGDQKAVFIVVNSGGDFTPDGTYASPVQVAYLYDGKNFLGKLPEFSISSHLDRMLGEDYIGTFDAPELGFADDLTLMACYMDITRGDK